MKKRKLWVGIVAAAVVVAVMALFASREDTAGGKPVVKIGATLQLSGNMAPFGGAVKKAVAAAVRDMNAKTGNIFFYRAVFEDNAGLPGKVQNTAFKLATVDRVNALISYFSADGRIVSRVAAERGILHFAHGYASDLLVGEYNFSNLPPLSETMEKIVEFLDGRGIGKTSLVFTNVSQADEMLALLEPALRRRGIAYDLQRYNPDERDFALLARRIKTYGGGAAVVHAFEPALSLLAREVRLQNLPQTFVFTDTLSSANDLAAFEGMYNAGSPLAPFEFKRHIGLAESAPVGLSHLVYDSATVIMSAFEEAGANGKIPSSGEVASAIFSMGEFDGIVGRYKILPNGQLISPIQLQIVKNGKLEPVK
ncbi:MAG: ABC transporter substrate-binding protein [Alphaproteobacteria bacterium]|nr:ABC transporter substrate-binding protein [Alphaproteobacteria bacterium]